MAAVEVSCIDWQASSLKAYTVIGQSESRMAPLLDN